MTERPGGVHVFGVPKLVSAFLSEACLAWNAGDRVRSRQLKAAASRTPTVAGLQTGRSTFNQSLFWDFGNGRKQRLRVGMLRVLQNLIGGTQLDDLARLHHSDA